MISDNDKKQRLLEQRRSGVVTDINKISVIPITIEPHSDENSKSIHFDNNPVIHEIVDSSDSRSNSKHKFEGGDGKKDGTPKKSKSDQEQTPENGGSHHGDNKKVNKITAFFPREAGPSTFDPEKLAKKLARAPTVATSAASDVTSSSNSTTSTQQSSTSASNSTPSNTIPSSALATINDLKRQVDSLKVLKEQQESKICRLDNDVKLINEKLKLSEERNSKVLKVLEDVYRNMAIQNARRKRDRLAADCVRLGKISTIRVSPSSLQDIWEEGYSLKELNAKINILTERKEELERRRKRLQSVKRISAKKNGNNVTLEAIVNDEDSFDSNTNAIDLDIIAEENAIKTHFEQIKKDEAILLEEKRLLESEKASHQKELKRCQSEDHSRFFQDLPLLNHRYLLMSLLGRGGFSEVWKAMDLVELKEVAVKLHQLNTSWSDARKQSYVKHVTREYTIHRDMMHPRVVQLYDVFEIDVNSFATVLEYCKGIDLDEKLKTCKTIPEKDAKTIILQIISGLRYLNSPHIPSSLMNSAAASSSSGNGDVSDAETANINVATMTSPNQMNTNTAAATSIALASGIPNSTQVRKRSIIHFDLKPANILFDEMGDVKITDFGLSKILDEGDNGSMTSMELTSQGAGTYWYLPPECFVGNEDEPPRISSKVDVWSLGVIFYQMLYGKRPFGEGKSQEKVLSERIMLSATQVDFGSNDGKGIKVSDEAKDFLSACLTWDQKLRPDVLALCNHPYLRSVPKK